SKKGSQRSAENSQGRQILRTWQERCYETIIPRKSEPSGSCFSRHFGDRGFQRKKTCRTPCVVKKVPLYVANMNKMNSNKKELSPQQGEELLGALKARFEKNMNRHKGLEWAKVQAKL